MKIKWNYVKFAEAVNNYGGVQKLAEKIGAGRQSIYVWMEGNTIPSSKNLIKLADALNINASDFFEEDKDD